jgi:hypothetical protein
MDNDWRLSVPPKEPKKNSNNHKQEPQRTWRRKRDKFNTDECSLSLEAQQNKSGWYVENNCLKHMTGDKNMFLTLKKERDGSVSFGNVNSTKIISRGTLKLGRKYAKEKNVLLFEDMKNNLLNFSQMCDQGHKLLFDSKKCDIRK